MALSSRHQVVATLSLAALVIGGCTADAPPDDGSLATGDALSSAGGGTTLYYLGSSSFLRQCAGNTLGCGRAVASVADTTPYFSAPRTWARSTCNQWYTFRANGKCVEAQRLEVSDTRNFIEGNPGLFDGLGLRHSDGTNCAGSGQAAVTMTAGRQCDVRLGTPTGAPLDAPPAADLPVPPIPPANPPSKPTPTPAPDGGGSSCKYRCTDYNYEPGECADKYYCQYLDGCLVYDASCK